MALARGHKAAPWIDPEDDPAADELARLPEAIARIQQSHPTLGTVAATSKAIREGVTEWADKPPSSRKAKALALRARPLTERQLRSQANKARHLAEQKLRWPEVHTLDQQQARAEARAAAGKTTRRERSEANRRAWAEKRQTRGQRPSEAPKEPTA